jgi:segregation and condensation protein B
VIGHKETIGRPGLYATTKQFLDDLSLPNLQSLPLLEDAAPTFESLGQGVIEFDESATVDTVITIDEGSALVDSSQEHSAEQEAEPKIDKNPSH